MRGWASFAFAAIVFAWGTFSVACGHQGATRGEGTDEVAEARAGGVRQKAEGLKSAAKSGALARAERSVEEVGRKAAHEVREHGLVGAIEEGAQVLEENVQHSTIVAKDTYRAEREQGVGRIQAAGDAYEAVLEIPKKKKAPRQEDAPG